MKKKLSAGLLTVMLITYQPRAEAAWNWYDRVLQPIVTNQVAPHWQKAIGSSWLNLASAVVQMSQHFSPIKFPLPVGIVLKNVSPDNTWIANEVKESEEWTKFFREVLATIGSRNNGAFGSVIRVIADNINVSRKEENKLPDDWDKKQDAYWKQERDWTTDDNKVTMVNLNVDPGTAPTNNSPAAAKLLNPYTKQDTDDMMYKYQMKVYNEKMAENKRSLERIESLTKQLHKVLGLRDGESVNDLLSSNIKTENEKLNKTLEKIESVSTEHSEKETKLWTDMMDTYTKASADAVRIMEIEDEIEYLSSFGGGEDGNPYEWEIRQLQKELIKTRNEYETLMTKYDKLNADYAVLHEKTGEQMKDLNESLEDSNKNIEKWSQELNQNKKEANEGNVQEEKERRAMIAGLTAAIKEERQKLKLSNGRVEQSKQIYEKQKEIIEQKTNIASMSYHGFDPYNPDEQDRKRGILPPEDKGFVTRKGYKKG